MTERRNNPADPAAERTADGSMQPASGLSSDRSGPGVERARPQDEDEDLIARDHEERARTPRQYEHPADDRATGDRQTGR